MKALILAAGQGERNKKNGDLKPLIPLLGLSLIERVVLTVKNQALKNFKLF